MSWDKATIMDRRQEFVMLARSANSPMAALCARFGVSRKTGYKWVKRAREAEDSGNQRWPENRSRKPLHSPSRTPEPIETAVLEERAKHPAWGGRKIHRRLEVGGTVDPPAPSTITEILRRHGKISEAESRVRQAVVRFEHKAPNDLWQMDFKGPVKMRGGELCHPLTVLDDCSRYALCTKALGNQQGPGVKAALIEVFRLYGLPLRILMDNGGCWGASATSRYTQLTVWLIRLGVGVTHGRPYHPQTQGKDERYHRTLVVEALQGRQLTALDDCQRVFDEFRRTYNEQRPHEALALETPASRYSISPTPYPEVLPPIEYLDTDIVRVGTKSGMISYQSRFFSVGRAFAGESLALRPTNKDGVFEVYYCTEPITRIDLTQPAYTKYVRTTD